VTFTQIITHPADGSDDIVVDVSDGEDSPACEEGEEMPGKSLDLKSLSEGNSVLLVDNQSLPQGDYSWIRLDIDPDNTFVVVDEGGEQLLLDCSSCDESHLKRNHSFNIEAEGWVAFTMDFDLRKSISHRRPNKEIPEDYDYKLRPTLRIVDMEIAGSFIWGHQAPAASSRPSMVLASRIVPSRTWSRAVASGSQWTSMSSWACGRDGTRDSCLARNR
jgi:hypothetical protein